MFSFFKTDANYYKGTKPVLDLQTYFSGDLKAWGVVQDLRGAVVQRLMIDMHGHWEGDKGVLSEDIHYYDGRREQRKWQLIKTGENIFVGTAEGIIGQAKGKSDGYSMRWNYIMAIPVDGRNMDVHFDDWMYALDEECVVNRSYIKKFGIKVAEVSIFIQKKKS